MKNDISIRKMGQSFISSDQKYSRLRCLLRVKGLFLFRFLWQYSTNQNQCLFVPRVGFCHCLIDVLIFAVFPIVVNLLCELPCGAHFRDPDLNPVKDLKQNWSTSSWHGVSDVRIPVGWGNSNIKTNIIKVSLKSWLLFCGCNMTLSLFLLCRES